jgi:hypothetical protein
MTKKKIKLNEFENILAEIVGIVGQKFHNNKINYYEALGVFEAAKHMFITIEEKLRLENNEEENEN